MSNLRADLKSDRVRIAKVATGNREITACVEGWESGVRVEGVYVDGKASFTIYMTNGSSAAEADCLIGEIKDGFFTPTITASSRRQ